MFLIDQAGSGVTIKQLEKTFGLELIEEIDEAPEIVENSET
jgi:hypothetical protein